MTDRRTYPANERVAHESLRGQVDGVQFTTGKAGMVALPVADLYIKTPTIRERQLLKGKAVTILEDHKDTSFVICDDGYVGYVPSMCLINFDGPTHSIATFATHLYVAEDFKSPASEHLTFGARVKVVAERQKFFETDFGFIPKKHLRPLDRPFDDPATIAQLHFNVPYLWGGNSTLGIDCSGLIQAALTACDIPCPGDSDMQCDQLGQNIPEDAPLQRGDIIFWKGHVGMMVDPDTLIHANAHHMACRYEGITQAILRIEAQGDGPVTARKRLG